MAKRYSGNLTINVVYDDKNFYRTSVSSEGKPLWSGTVNPAPVGFGPGVAYDSPQAYDEVAGSAIAFADDEVSGVADEAEYDENLTGYLIRRKPPARPARSHSTRKTSGGTSDGSWDTVATVSSDWVADAGSAASDLADAVERKFGVERMIEGSWPNYRVLAKGDEKTLEKARVFAAQWLADHGEREAKRIKAARRNGGAAHAAKAKKGGSRGIINYHLGEIDAWRSGQRATPGLSASGDRYAGSMLDAIKRHELALIALGHKPTIDYVQAHGFADGQRGRL
ncbi:MAG TPA: hypothetical protein VLE97_07130 [Gaiellaceae bacterium]|nr:hypothetical protein [Gaiellaceae bacterium]